MRYTVGFVKVNDKFVASKDIIIAVDAVKTQFQMAILRTTEATVCTYLNAFFLA